MKKILMLFLIQPFFIFFSFFCNQNKVINQKFYKEQQLEKEVKPEKRPQEKWEQFAKFISADSQNITHPHLKQFVEKQWYIKYKEKIEKHIKTFQHKEKILVDWRKTFLPETKNISNGVYLLSGADFFHFYLFFPEAKNYIMTAMEKPGELFDYQSFSEQDFMNSLKVIEQVIHNLAYSGYFFSRTMDAFLNKDKQYKIYGTLPVVFFFIHYFQWNIEDVKEFCNFEQNQICLEKGYQIKIFKNDREANIIYLSKKLMPDDVKPDSNFIKFLNQFSAQKALFLKSAVYLFHYKSFREFATYLAKNFDAVIQDDSGIPYSILKSHNFQFKFFGEYIDTPHLKETIHPLQPEMVKDFKDNSSGKLPFEFGYGFARGSKRSNLIYAFK